MTQKPQHPGAVPDIGHLVVVVQPGLERRPYLVHVRLQQVAWIGATLVLHLAVDDELREPSHCLQVGQPRIDQVNQTDLVERLVHAPGQFATRFQVRLAHGEFAAVDGK